MNGKIIFRQFIQLSMNSYIETWIHQELPCNMGLFNAGKTTCNGGMRSSLVVSPTGLTVDNFVAIDDLELVLGSFYRDQSLKMKRLPTWHLDRLITWLAKKNFINRTN